MIGDKIEFNSMVPIEHLVYLVSLTYTSWQIKIRVAITQKGNGFVISLLLYTLMRLANTYSVTRIAWQMVDQIKATFIGDGNPMVASCHHLILHCSFN